MDLQTTLCDGKTIDATLLPSVTAFSGAMDEIAATICEVAKLQTGQTDQKISDLETKLTAKDNAVIEVLEGLKSTVNELATNPQTAGLTASEVTAIVTAVTASAVADALAFAPDAKEQLDAILLMLEDNTQLQNFADMLTRINRIEDRLDAVEAGKYTDAQAACVAAEIVNSLSTSFAAAAAGTRQKVMECMTFTVAEPATVR
jgi:hypothetical protein